MKKLRFINFSIFLILFFLLRPADRVYSAPGDNSVWCDANCNTTDVYCDSGYVVPSDCQAAPTNCCHTLYPGGNCPQYIPCVLAAAPSPTPTNPPAGDQCATGSFNCWYYPGFGCRVDSSTAHCEPGFAHDESVCSQHDGDQYICQGQFNNCCILITPTPGGTGQCWECVSTTDGCLSRDCSDPAAEYTDWNSCHLACTGQTSPAPEEYDDYSMPGFKPTECDYNGDGTNDGIQTALGCIPTQDTGEFVVWILRLAIGIGGGIAFLLMILGGIKMITSAGNPEGVKAGQELISSALMGLIFIIFSLFLLQLIGVKIFQIPGFGE